MTKLPARFDSVAFAIFTIIIAMISIQSGASLAKQLFPIIGPQGATALRLFFATIMLGIVWRPWRRKFTQKEIWITFLYGAALGGMNFFFYLALERIPLGIAVAFEFIGPLALAFYSSKKILDFLWASLAVCGIILILPVSQFSAPLDMLGVLYAIVAGAFWALYIFFGQKAGAAVHGGMATTLGMLSATVLVAPFGIFHSGGRLLQLNTQTLLLAILVGILSSALPYSLEMIALKKLPAQSFSILMSLEPAIGALSGLIFLKEVLTFTQWMAIVLVILASIGTSLGTINNPMKNFE